MTTSSMSDSWELADYIRVLRRRWRVVTAITFLGLLIGGAIVALEGKTYTATASVYVAAIPTESRPTTGAGLTVNMDTEAHLARSNAVAQLAAKHLQPSPPVARLASDISVTVPASTTLLDIACQAATATRAVACANAVAAAYLSTRRASAASAVTGQLTALRSKAQSILPGVVKANLEASPTQGKSPGTTSTTLTRRLQAKAASAQLDALVARINTLTGDLASLQRQSAGRVVNAASSPSSPSSPKTVLLLPSGLVAGLIMGLIVAFVREFRDERITGAREVERDYGVPALLDLRAKDMRAVSDPGLVGSLTSGRFSELAEYVAAAPREGPLVVLVVGAFRAAATSLVAANLAAVLSEARSGVQLVCATPGETLVPWLLGLEGRGGVAELLAGEATSDEVIQTPRDLPNLRVIPPGSETVGAHLRRNYDARRKLIAELRSRAQYVILESFLTQDESPVFTLAEFADSAIIVVETSTTKRSDVEGWLRHFDRIRIPVLGAVVVPRLADARRSGSPLARVLRRRAVTPEPLSSRAMPAETAGVAEQQLTQ